MLHSWPFPFPKCAPSPLRLPHPTIGSDPVWKTCWTRAMNSSAWPVSWMGNDATRPSVHGMAPTGVAPASLAVGGSGGSICSLSTNGRPKPWRRVGGESLRAILLRRGIFPAPSADRRRPDERHRDAAGVAAGHRGYDGAGPNRDLPDRPPVAEPFPGATGEVVSVV